MLSMPRCHTGVYWWCTFRTLLSWLPQSVWDSPTHESSVGPTLLRPSRCAGWFRHRGTGRWWWNQGKRTECEERIYCYSVTLPSLVKIWKTNVEIIYSLVLTSLSRKQPVDLLSVNLFVKSKLYLVFKLWSICKKPLSTCVAFGSN